MLSRVVPETLETITLSLFNKALTIDGAGHTITIASTAGFRGFAIINNTDESMAVEFKNKCSLF